MPSASPQPPAPFASLSGRDDAALRRRWSLAQLFIAPFRDVDDRVALLAAAVKAQRDARRAAMSDEVPPRRR